MAGKVCGVWSRSTDDGEDDEEYASLYVASTALYNRIAYVVTHTSHNAHSQPPCLTHSYGFTSLKIECVWVQCATSRAYATTPRPGRALVTF
jgi:hypothetical protein